MACCIIAAFLVAQAMAMLRRWGVFWGLVRVPPGETADTAWSRLASFLASSRVRAVLAVIAVAELSAVGVWLYTDHRDHVVEFADVAWSRMQGERVVYVGMCGEAGDFRRRLVLDPVHAS